MNAIPTMQELGHNVERVTPQHVSVVKEDRHPVIFSQGLSDLFGNEKVVHIRWIQKADFRTSAQGTVPTLKVEFGHDSNTGLVLDLHEDKDYYFNSFLNELDNTPERFLNEMEGVPLGRIPEDLEYVSKLLRGGNHDEMLFRSFGLDVIVTASKDGNRLKFVVESLND